MSSIPALTVGSALQSAQQGIDRGVAAIDRDAAAIASVSAGIEPSQDVTQALIDASQQKLYVDASTKALSIAAQSLNDALGRLVDTHA
jgi:hypothetical protein